MDFSLEFDPNKYAPKPRTGRTSMQSFEEADYGSLTGSSGRKYGVTHSSSSNLDPTQFALKPRSSRPAANPGPMRFTELMPPSLPAISMPSLRLDALDNFDQLDFSRSENLLNDEEDAEEESASSRVNLKGVRLALGDMSLGRCTLKMFFPTPRDAKHAELYIKRPKRNKEFHCEDALMARPGEAYDQAVAVCVMLASREGIHRAPGHYIPFFQTYSQDILSAGNRIGLTAYMNGIDVDRSEFKEYGRIIYSMIGKATEVVGLYDPTSGFVVDAIKLLAQLHLAAEAQSVTVMTRFLETAAEVLYGPGGIGFQGHMLMVVHSKGGLNLHQGMEAMDARLRNLINRHLCIIALGSVHPIPKKSGIYVSNIYSSKDLATMHFAKPYYQSEDRDDYEITVVGNKTPPKDRKLWYIDHAFKGKTYQKHLGQQIENLGRIYGFK